MVLNRFSIWYTTVLLQHTSTFIRAVFFNGSLAVYSALTPNSTITQSTLNLLYDSAFLAYMYIYGNTYYNLVFDSATAAHNGTLTANNAPTPNSTFTQSILNSEQHVYLVQWYLYSKKCTTSEQHIHSNDSQFAIWQCYCSIHIC